ncbi:MAG: MarR family transcriptional regulator [Nitrococcus sp.]|nr:MarR family transcriptional regulator [Nitrococcus sp.]
MKRIMHITVESTEAMESRFIERWKRIERGDTTPYYGISFADMASMLSSLTPKRWELIQSLRRSGPLTVYALAKALSRDYKNVHTDVAALEAIDLIERTEDGKVCVPWDEIEARIRLAA